MTETVFNTFIGSQIKAARIEKGITHVQLAAFLELTRASIYNIEVGKQRIMPYTLYKLAALFHEPISYFFPIVQPIEIEFETKEIEVVKTKKITTIKVK